MRLEFYKFPSGETVEKEVKEIKWSVEEASKNGYEHFMLKEILEEPRCFRQALMQDEEYLTKIALEILRYKDVIITACGTSRHASLIGRYLFSRIADKFCDVIAGSELQYFADSMGRGTLVIAVSQSGETADVIQGIKLAKQKGAKIVGIINVVDSTLARLSDYVIYINAGPELCVAATKSFLNQLAVFYLLSFAMAGRLREGKRELKNLAPLIERTLKENLELAQRLAGLTKHKKDFYYIARGINFAIACEGALKLKEISYVHAEGMPAGELKHGTLALIEDGTPVVAIAPRDYTYVEMQGNIEEAKARGAMIIGVSDENFEKFDYRFPIPSVEEIYYPLLAVLPLQLFAYYHAVSRGLNPDKPRNLAKSVTVK